MLKKLNKSSISEGGYKILQPAKLQVTWWKKISKFNTLLLMAFLALFGAGLSRLALPARDGARSVPGFTTSHSAQHPMTSTASALFAAAVVLLTQKTLPANSSRLSAPMGLRAALKSALAPAGISQLCSLHAASAIAPRRFVTICQLNFVNSLPFYPCNYRSKMPYCKNSCGLIAHFLHAFEKSAKICVC